MNKGELIKTLSKKTNLPKKFAENTLNSFISVVSEELKKGKKVQLVGFKVTLSFYINIFFINLT